MDPAFALNKLIAYAISEESGGSDVLSINTTATQLGDEWVINGSKSWITASGKADGYLIAARTSLNQPQPRYKPFLYRCIHRRAGSRHRFAHDRA